MRLILSVLCGAFLASAADLSATRNVYLLPMQSGLDQYLANRLTEKKVFNVVTDPQSADAILTDRIGEGFEEKLDELYPEEANKPKTDEDDANVWASKRPRSASFARGRGTLFLVDRKSRDVIWSIYSPSRSGRPQDLNRNAGSIAGKILDTIRPKSK